MLGFILVINGLRKQRSSKNCDELLRPLLHQHIQVLFDRGHGRVRDRSLNRQCGMSSRVGNCLSR
jgi:hypothetical protein